MSRLVGSPEAAALSTVIDTATNPNKVVATVYIRWGNLPQCGRRHPGWETRLCHDESGIQQRCLR